MKGSVENAAAEEIKEEAFGDILLMISTSCLESTKRFPHFPQIRRRVLTTKKCVTYVSERTLTKQTFGHLVVESSNKYMGHWTSQHWTADESRMLTP